MLFFKKTVLYRMKNRAGTSRERPHRTQELKTKGYLYSFDRMVFQQTGKQDNAGRFERGYLKVTTENLTNWDLPGCEKPPKTN